MNDHMKRGGTAMTSKRARSGDGSRREFLIGGAAVVAAAAVPSAAITRPGDAAEAATGVRDGHNGHTVTTPDGAEIFYKDWGPKSGQPIVFHHGWPLSGDD